MSEHLSQSEFCFGGASGKVMSFLVSHSSSKKIKSIGNQDRRVPELGLKNVVSGQPYSGPC